jgi:hypothetical protein
MLLTLNSKAEQIVFAALKERPTALPGLMPKCSEFEF